MKANVHETREGWLLAGAKLLDKQFFDGNGYTLPKKLACSCGFPRGAKGKAIGQCWGTVHSTDGTANMFICPTQDDAVQVLGILLHELIHAWNDCKDGHKGPFKKLVKEFGLAGKATATYVDENSELFAKISHIASELGPYPHKKMVPVKKTTERGSMGGWLRLTSPNDEKYKVLISPKQLEEHGAPVDPWGDKMTEGGEPEEE